MMRLYTLCCPDVQQVDGLTATAVLKHPKRVASLAYLAVARPNGFHSLDTLLAMFWPEHDSSHARISLRQGSDVIVTRDSDCADQFRSPRV